MCFFDKGCSFTSLIASSSWSNPTKKVVEKLAYQHIPTSNIPTMWEYVIMMKGGKMTPVTSPSCNNLDDNVEGKR